MNVFKKGFNKCNRASYQCYNMYLYLTNVSFSNSLWKKLGVFKQVQVQAGWGNLSNSFSLYKFRSTSFIYYHRVTTKRQSPEESSARKGDSPGRPCPTPDRHRGACLVVQSPNREYLFNYDWKLKIQIIHNGLPYLFRASPRE